MMEATIITTRIIPRSRIKSVLPGINSELPDGTAVAVAIISVDVTVGIA
jgi:hypothetical protein